MRCRSSSAEQTDIHEHRPRIICTCILTYKTYSAVTQDLLNILRIPLSDISKILTALHLKHFGPAGNLYNRPALYHSKCSQFPKRLMDSTIRIFKNFGIIGICSCGKHNV